MARTDGTAGQRVSKRKQAPAAGPTAIPAIGPRLEACIRQAEAGDLAAAEPGLVCLAGDAPQSADVWHALGYVRHLLGRNDLAVEDLRKAVDLEPENGSFRNSLAIVLQHARRLDEALDQVRAAALCEPANPVFQFNMGNVLKDAGRFADAAAAYRKALAAHPDDPEILNNLGQALSQGDGAEEAVALLVRAAALRPDDPRIHYSLAMAHRALGEHRPALDALGRSLDLDGDYHPAVLAQARIRLDRREYVKAVALFRRYLELQPEDHVVMRALVELLSGTGRHAEARHWVSKLRALTPDDPVSKRLLGCTLVDQDDIEGAIAVFQGLREAHPDFPDASLDLGQLYIMMERFSEAEACIESAAASGSEPSRLFYLRSRLAEARGDLREARRLQEESVRLDPEDGGLCERLGLLSLAMGDLDRGFVEHDRRRIARPECAEEFFPAPLWQGEPLDGKRLLIAAEQGIGDELIHGSCIPDAIRAAGECVIECDARLMPLYARSFPEARIIPAQKDLRNRFAVRSNAWQSAEGRPDYAVPVCSLGRWFRRTLPDFPSPGGYLTVDPARVDHWRRRLAGLGPGLKVGLCWRSGLNTVDRRRYYTGIEDWAPLLRTPGLVMVNLQYDDCRDEVDRARRDFGAEIHTLPGLDLYNDFDNMAAMMRALDLVVSVSTVMPCLAAACGQRVLGLAIATDWSLLGTQRYPWLPDLTPVIRRHGEDWSAAIGEIARRVAVMAADADAVRAA